MTKLDVASTCVQSRKHSIEVTLHLWELGAIVNENAQKGTRLLPEIKKTNLFCTGPIATVREMFPNHKDRT